MKVLLAGVAGFLGSHLLDRLLSDGHAVIGVDNFSTGSLENVSHLSSGSSFELIESDVEKLPFSINDLDLIVHMASPASPKYFERLPLEISSANTNGTVRLLELARRNSARFLFASTSEFYGDPLVHPQKENYNGNVNPVSIRGVYDESKRLGEALTMTYYRMDGVDTRIARIFNTYGPRMQIDDGRVVPNFLVQSLQGKDLTVYGDGSQTRSFCYISDMIEVIMRLIVHGNNPEIHFPLNLGNPQEISILDLANKVLDMTASGVDIDFKEIPEGDPCVRCPDILNASSILKWKPCIDIEDGLMKTIKYFMSIKDFACMAS